MSDADEIGGRLAKMSNPEILALVDRWDDEDLSFDEQLLLCRKTWYELVLGSGRRRDGVWAECCRTLGDWWLLVDQLDHARGAYMMAENVYRKQGSPEAAACVRGRGRALLHVGRYQEALTAFLEAKLLFKEHGLTTDSGECDAERGIALQGLGRFQESLEALDEAKDVLVGAEMAVWSVAELNAYRACALAGLGSLAEARNLIKEAQAALLEQEAPECLFAYGLVLLRTGRLGDALEVFDDVKAASHTLGMSDVVAMCDLGRCMVFARRGSWEEARTAEESHRAASLQRSDSVAVSPLETFSEMSHGLLLLMSGHYLEAVEVLANAGAMSCRQGNPSFHAEASLHQAKALIHLGRFPEAMSLIGNAKAGSAQGLLQIAGWCDLATAWARDVQGRYAEAIGPYEAALSIFTGLELLDGQVRAHYGLAQTHFALSAPGGEDPELHRAAARDHFGQACDILEEALSRVGGTERDLSGFRETLPDPYSPLVRLLLQDRQQSEGAGDAARARALLEEAFLLSERSRSAKLREELRQALATGGLDPTGLDPELRDRYRALQARLSALDGDLPEGGTLGAVISRRQAQEPQRQAIAQELDAVGAELFKKSAEAAGLLSAQLPPLTDILSAYREDEGLVSYLVCEEDLICFLADRKGIHHVSVLEDRYPQVRTALQALGLIGPQTPEEKAETSPTPLFLMEGGDYLGGAHHWEALLAGLGEVLLTPLGEAGWLSPGAKKARLTIVPARELHRLPFAALPVPDSGRYLIQEVALSVSPQAVTRYYQKDKGSVPVGEDGLVALLNPEPDTGLYLGSDSREVALRSAFPELGLHRGEVTAITPETLPALSQGADLLHLLCHGEFLDYAPAESAFRLRGGSRLSARELYTVPGRRFLFFAEACESGMYQVRHGEGLLGLTRALLYSSRYVVSTLWRVREDATAELTRLFYQALASQLAAGQPPDPVLALQAAQLAFLDPQHPEHSLISSLLLLGSHLTHPYFWAGLVMQG